MRPRWLILILLTILAFQNGYAEISFGSVNDVYSYYFSVTHAETDWAIAGVYAGMLLAAPVMAWLNNSKLIAMRMATILFALTLLLSVLFIVIAIVARRLYILIIIGEVFNGIARALIYSLLAKFAVAWFPESQVGTAMGSVILAGNAGGIVGAIIPGIVLKRPNENYTINCTVKEQLKSVWMDYNQPRMLAIYCPALAITAVLFIFVLILVPDLPPKPPTLAQAVKRLQTTSANLTDNFFSATKKLFGEIRFVLVIVISGFVGRAYVVEASMLTELIREFSNLSTIEIAPNILGGYALTLCLAGWVLGTISGGKLLDKWKNYKFLFSTSSIATFLGCVGLALSVYFSSYSALCLTIFFFGWTFGINLITSYEIATQETYPMDELFVTLWLNGGQGAISMIAAGLARVMLNHLGGAAMLITQSATIAISFGLSLLLRLRYKRLNFSRGENYAGNNEHADEVSSVDEQTALLIRDS
ncbi:unnamed protein product [Clavelina lepadiformis]|uniref:Major facilitator superfamily (MFS) profile domain-containing protein n=1 Tax=Clavelina lepadiformis TaxID=159417 RepID=A0ABP0FL67_CLALP